MNTTQTRPELKFHKAPQFLASIRPTQAPPAIFLRRRPTYKITQAPAVNYPDLLSAGIALIEGGVNVIPVNDHKTPALKEWTPYQSRQTTIAELKSWCKKKYVRGLAMVGGKISGGLAVFDIDVAGFSERFIEAIKRNKEVRELAYLLPIQQTGSGNYQMAFRCSLPLRNDKLAWVPADNEQGRGTAIETRAEGGYAVVSPSYCPQAEKHGIKHKQAYRVIQGDFASVPTITDEQARHLIEVARSLCQVPVSIKQMQAAPLSPRSNGGAGGNGVIGSFNAFYEVGTILSRNNYQLRGDRYLAPDSTTGLPGVHIFSDTGRCFSHHSNDPLNDGHAHNAFSVFCILEHGGDVKAAVKAAAAELGIERTHDRPQAPPADDAPRAPLCGHLYLVDRGRLCLEGADREGKPKFTPLANFTAQITDEIDRDDGLTVTKEFLINGKMNTGKPFTPARIQAKDFDSMRWIRDVWGAEASIAPARTQALHVPNAILAFSQEGIQKRTVYTHTGWRKVNGVFRYLHGGGAIGVGPEVTVDLGDNLKLFRLPAPGGVEAAPASQRVLDIGPWEVMVPIMSCVYLAPLANLLKVDFSLWI